MRFNFLILYFTILISMFEFCRSFLYCRRHMVSLLCAVRDPRAALQPGPALGCGAVSYSKVWRYGMRSTGFQVTASFYGPDSTI